jgi:hypothetical protein
VLLLQIITLWCTLIGCLCLLSLATTRRYYTSHIEDEKQAAAAEAEDALAASETTENETTAVNAAVDTAPSADKLDALVALITAWAAETRRQQPPNPAGGQQLGTEDAPGGTSARGSMQAPQAPRRAQRASADSQPPPPPLQATMSGSSPTFCMPFMSINSGGIMAPVRRPRMDTQL